MAKHVCHLADGGKAYAFNCGTYRRYGAQFCTPHTIPLKVLEEIVLSDLRIIVRHVHDLREFVAQHHQSASKTKKMVDTEKGKLESELERIKKRKQSVYEDYKEGLISRDEFLSYRAEYLKKEELYAKQMEALAKKMEKQTAEDIFETPWLKHLLEQRDIEKLDREMVVEMIHEIIIYENDKIKIRYNFSNELEHLFSSIYSLTGG